MEKMKWKKNLSKYIYTRRHELSNDFTHNPIRSIYRLPKIGRTKNPLSVYFLPPIKWVGLIRIKVDRMAKRSNYLVYR